MIAPAVGGPANVAKSNSMHTMPGWVPILLVSFFRIASDPSKTPDSVVDTYPGIKHTADADQADDEHLERPDPGLR